MTSIGVHCMRDDPQLLQGRLASFVRQRADAKTLARMIDCDVRTAENIRRGHWPTARHWLGLIAAFGADVTEAVFHPDQAAARLEAEVRALEEQLEERKAALRETAGPGARAPQAVAPVLDRAAVTRNWAQPAAPKTTSSEQSQ